MRPSLLLFFLCSSTAFPSLAGAQTRGPAAVWKSGFSLETTTGLDPIRIKPSGDQTSMPLPGALLQPVPAPAVPPPDYRLMSLFPGIHDLIEIDALSTGNDLVIVSPVTQKMDLAGRWAGISVSVNKYAQGLPGSVAATRRQSAGGNGIGGDIFSYWIDSGGNLGPGVSDNTFLEQGAEHIGLDPDSEIDAFDWFLPVIQTRSGFAGAIFVKFDTIYFSITENSADQLLLANVKLDDEDPSPAAVYAIHWQPDPNQPTQYVWSDVEIAYTPAELGLLETDEVDAIGVNSVTTTIVFSTSREGSTFAGTQLMVAGGALTSPTPLVDSSGTPVVTLLGLTTEDDVDAVCDFDPELGEYSPFFGIPYQVPAGLPFSISATRDIDVTTGAHQLVVGLYAIPPSTPAGSPLGLHAVDVEFTLPITPLASTTTSSNQEMHEFRVSIPPPDSTYYLDPIGQLHGYPGTAAYLAGVVEFSGQPQYSWLSTFRF